MLANEQAASRRRVDWQINLSKYTTGPPPLILETCVLALANVQDGLGRRRSSFFLAASGRCNGVLNRTVYPIGMVVYRFFPPSSVLKRVVDQIISQMTYYYMH
jgi:hypothetical protein